MTPLEFRDIRLGFDLSAAEWGIALGYTGKRANIRQTISRYEDGERPLPTIVARLASMYQEHGIPEDFDPCPEKG